MKRISETMNVSIAQCMDNMNTSFHPLTPSYVLSVYITFYSLEGESSVVKFITVYEESQ